MFQLPVCYFVFLVPKKTHLLIQTHVEQTGAIQAHPALKEGQQEVKKRNIVHEVWFFDVTQEILM